MNVSVSIVSFHNYGDIITLIKSIEDNIDKGIDKNVYIIDNSSLREQTYVKENSDYNKLINFISSNEDYKIFQTKENLGFGKGHNYVIDQLDSDYHMVINPDVIFIEDSFSKLLEYMEDNKVDCCIPKIVDENYNLQPIYRREITILDLLIRNFGKNHFKERYEYHTMKDQDFLIPFKVPFGQGSFLVFKTELFKELNGFDDRYFMYLEDADLCRRVNEKTSLIYFPGTTVVHKWERGSHKSFQLFRYHVSSMIKYFIKWGIKWV